MTGPETCGAAGGTISMWLKVTGCENVSGILSSQRSQAGSYFYIGYDRERIR